MVVFKKKRGKNATFFINPIAQDRKKNDDPDNVEKTHKSPESPKGIKKLESFSHRVPGNFQIIAPNMPAIYTLLLYRKDNLDGHSSNVSTDDRFFYEEILFLRRELDQKQKTNDNLLKIYQTNLVKIFPKIRILSLSRLT